MTVTLEVPMDAKRVTVRISADAWQDLVGRTEEDGITMSDRIGALVEMWHTDPEIRHRAEPLVKATAAESRRRRYGRTST